MAKMNDFSGALQVADEYFERCRQIQNLANSQPYIHLPSEVQKDDVLTKPVQKEEVIVLDDDDDNDILPETNGNHFNMTENENDVDITSVEVLKEWIDISELDITKHAIIDNKTDLVNSYREDVDNNWADLDVEEDDDDKGTDSTDEKFKCEYCPYKTNWRNNLTKHIISRHIPKEKIDWFQCAHCMYKGKTKEYLISHLKLHHIIRWFNCPLCPKNFKTKQALQKHEVVHDVDRELFECTLCGHKSKTKELLNDHVYLLHSKENEIQWFQCDQCSYKGKKKKNLKMHMYNKHATVEELKWYQCEHCEYQAKTKKYLRQHCTSQHTEKNVMEKERDFS